MSISVGMVSLGCAKNQVDAEMLMASLEQDGFELKDDAALADIAIVNTCGFIDSAKKEAVEEILELTRLKSEGRIQKVVVTGCLAQRYQDEISREIPEVDAVLGIGANGEIAAALRKMMQSDRLEWFPSNEKMPLCGARRLSTPSYFAYVKIAEGCNHRCTFCAIPAIRGPFRSRAMEDILEEARTLARNGAQELILIAQDTSRYGMDIYGKFSLSELLRQLCKIDGIRWIRTLYCYPEAVTDELLTVMAEEEKIVKYLDLPLQHASGRILKSMMRAGNRESLTKLIYKIRRMVPDITLRTTFIAGFPGETEEDFTELAEFVKEMRFDRMGCFPYSQEEGTPAAAMPDQIDEDIRYRRAELLMDSQMYIMQEKGESLIGQTIEVLVEGYDRYAGCWFGRSRMDAPDIDGKVFLVSGDDELEESLSSDELQAPPDLPGVSMGRIVMVQVTDCMDGDLVGVPLNPDSKCF